MTNQGRCRAAPGQRSPQPSPRPLLRAGPAGARHSTPNTYCMRTRIIAAPWGGNRGSPRGAAIRAIATASLRQMVETPKLRASLCFGPNITLDRGVALGWLVGVCTTRSRCAVRARCPLLQRTLPAARAGDHIMKRHGRRRRGPHHECAADGLPVWHGGVPVRSC